MRVLLTDPHLRGGGQVRYIENLVGYLVTSGCEVMIGCKRGSILEEIAETKGALVFQNFVFRGGGRPGAWINDIRAMRSVLNNFKPDIIHVNGSQDHWIAAVTNCFYGKAVPIVRTRHNTYQVNSHFLNKILNKSWTTFQICVCELVRERLAAHPAFDPERLIAIHNGIYPDIFCPDEAKRSLARGEFGYQNEDIVIGIVARLVPAKGHKFLFQAVSRLLPIYPNIKVLVLGEGPLRKELEQMILNLELRNAIQFGGFRKDTAFCMQAIDIGVQPSIDCDTSSFSLKELMALEKPVVASDYGGLPEIVTDGVEGFIVKAGDVDSLVKALGNLLWDKDLRAKMGKAGRKRVLRDFTVEQFGKKTLKVYELARTIHHPHDGSTVDR